MKYLVYMSAAIKLFNNSELAVLLQQSRDNNKRNALTGMLLYSYGSFVQALEGDEQMVDAVFERIKLDSRHKRIIMLAEGSLQKRLFPYWSMGFKTASEDEVAQFEAYVDPSAAQNFEGNIHPALTILKVFAENNRL